MAKNREPEKPVNPQSESDEEEDDEVSSEEVESDSESDQTQVTKKAATLPSATQKMVQAQSAAKTPLPASSSEEEETGSESESDSEEPAQNVKPIASKPMDEPQKSKNANKKMRSKPNAPEPVTPAKLTTAKRPAEEKDTDAKDAKKPRKKSEPETSEKKPNDDSKKLLFQRIWSEDDEIVILKGMIDYANKKKSDPVADLNAFHDFIKKNLHVDVTRTQLQDKIRRLKKKYENNKNKEKEGKDRTFSKPHEQKAYELSRSIWGGENAKENGADKVVGSPAVNASAVKKTPVKKANAGEEVKDVKNAEVVDGEGEKPVAAKRLNLNGVKVEERVSIVGAELFEVEKGLEGEKEWKKLRVEEMELYLKQLELRTAQTKLVLDALKSTDL